MLKTLQVVTPVPAAVNITEEVNTQTKTKICCFNMSGMYGKPQIIYL